MNEVVELTIVEAQQKIDGRLCKPLLAVSLNTASLVQPASIQAVEVDHDGERGGSVAVWIVSNRRFADPRTKSHAAVLAGWISVEQLATPRLGCLGWQVKSTYYLKDTYEWSTCCNSEM